MERQGAIMTLSEELVWRGFIKQTTLTDISLLDKKKWTFYHGYDASANSLTVGNLASLMLDKCFVRHGHKAIILAGGATSLIGDPGGKDSERPLRSTETIHENIAQVRAQMVQLLGDSAVYVNNLDWYTDMGILIFLRDIGKHFSMTPLVQRDYIATRMGEGGAGISYTEFSYTLLQGYDFLYLNRKFGVELQLAGSDQWGNGISGVELVRKVEGKDVHVLTTPLVINKATGRKFGKSENGAVWLDPAKTSVYQFYQFWLNIDDEGVEEYLKVFTELDKPQVDDIMDVFLKDKGKRHAQKVLAYEVTKFVHGEERARSVRRATEALFGNDTYSSLLEEDFQMLATELRKIEVGQTDDLLSVAVRSGLVASNNEARRLLAQGAFYINGVQVKSNASLVTFESISGFYVMRRGKNTNAILEIK